MKTRLTIQEYCQLYPTGSNPGRFYGTAKLHKLPPNGTKEDLPIRPIVFNMGIASYSLAKKYVLWNKGVCSGNAIDPLS